MNSSVLATVMSGISAEWALANSKNDALVRRVFGQGIEDRLSEQLRERYFGANDDVLKAFGERRVAGMNLSQRVWKRTEPFKSELEDGIDAGLRDGKSAAEISRVIRQYLNSPDMRFRRVRDDHGNLVLSKRAAEYHPGAGVYRSSYKNAIRLTGTEVNMAYRTADYERWRKMDFVVGMEIHLSNNHTLNGKPFTDICDELAGRYPKDFKFTGWHPQCRCYATSILKTEEEMAEDDRRILNGEEPTSAESSENYVGDVPDNFKDWVGANQDRISTATANGTLPYFISDNRSMVSGVLNMASLTTVGKGSSLLMEESLSGRSGNVTSKESAGNKESLHLSVASGDPKVSEAVSKTEDGIRNQDVEYAVVFDKHGNIHAQIRGARNHVSLESVPDNELKDSIVSHNHTQGNSFSPADIRKTVISDLAEIRVVTSNHIFSMSRPENGWGNINGEMIDNAIDSICTEINREFNRAILDGRMTAEQADIEFNHETMKRLAEKFGWKYSWI